MPSSFKKGLDAALWREDNKALYFFKGDSYVRFNDGSNTVADSYPRKIAGNWKGLPSNFKFDLSAVFWRDSKNKIYFFKGGEYVRLSNGEYGVEMDSGYPKSISANWLGLNPGSSGISAALMRRDTNQIYFFFGRRYVRFSKVSDGVDPGYPKYIDGIWMPFPRS